MTLRHRVAHWFGWNLGNVESWRMDNGEPYIGFRCATCRRIFGEPMRHALGKSGFQR